MQAGWKVGIKNLITKNLIIIFFVIFIFVVGTVFGSMAIKNLESAKKQEMLNFLSGFFSGITGNFQEGYLASFKDTIWMNLRFLLIMWILSLSIIGIIAIPFFVFLRGFVIGFTVGFLVSELGIKGVVFALASILPHNLIIIPMTLLAGIVTISFGVDLLKSLFFKKRVYFSSTLVTNLLLLVLIGGGLVIASFIETFITPVFMEMAAKIVLKG